MSALLVTILLLTVRAISARNGSHSDVATAKVFKCCGRELYYDAVKARCLPATSIQQKHPILASVWNKDKIVQSSAVVVVGYGLPTLSFDSFHQTRVNKPDQAAEFVVVDDDSKYRIPSLQLTANGEVRDEYCLDRAFSSDDGAYLGTMAVFSQLKPDIECRSRPCLRSCCPQGMVYRDEVCSPPRNTSEAAKNAAIWSPSLINRRNREVSNIYQDYKYFYGLPHCGPKRVYDQRVHAFFFQERRTTIERRQRF